MPENCVCKHEAKITVLEQRDLMIQESLNELKAKVDMILMQVTKVAVLEVNHGHHSAAMERAFAQIKVIEDATASHIKASEAFMSETKGMAKMAWVLWGLLSSGFGLLALKVILAGH